MSFGGVLADWRTHGKSAGQIRNAAMGAYANAAVILWDGESKGAANMAWTMRMLGKPVHQVICGVMNPWHE